MHNFNLKMVYSMGPFFKVPNINALFILPSGRDGPIRRLKMAWPGLGLTDLKIMVLTGIGLTKLETDHSSFIDRLAISQISPLNI